MIIEDMISLKNEFLRIKNMGYVRSTRSGYTGVGKTFEDLIGKQEDRECAPDYKGIEIKTKLGYTKAYLNLFNYSPRGNSSSEIKRIVSKFGYNRRKLNTIVNAKNPTFVRNRYLFKLKINYQEERIYLEVYNKYLDFLERESYWDFKEIKRKLYTKLKYLAIVKAWIKRDNNINYYKYYCINFYKLKDFDNFLELLEKGIINIAFKIGSENNRLKDYGTAFSIDENNLTKIFDKIDL